LRRKKKERVMAATKKALNKKIRQEALREQLCNQGHVQQVIVNVEKLETQGVSMESTELQALKAATDIRLKLISKYLPDLKQAEIEINGELNILSEVLSEIEEIDGLPEAED